MTEQPEPQRPCPRCGAIIVETFPKVPGRPRRWCSAKCRRSASEERRATAAGAIATQYVPAEVSIDDHVRAVLASPAACRRVLRDLRERQDAGELGDGRWRSVAEELQRTRPQHRSTLQWGVQ